MKVGGWGGRGGEMCVWGGDGGKMERQEARVKGRMACGECRGEGVRRVEKSWEIGWVWQWWGKDGEEVTSTLPLRVRCRMYFHPPSIHIRRNV